MCCILCNEFELRTFRSPQYYMHVLYCITRRVVENIAPCTSCLSTVLFHIASGLWDHCLFFLFLQYYVELEKNPTLGLSITGGKGGENAIKPGDPVSTHTHTHIYPWHMQSKYQYSCSYVQRHISFFTNSYALMENIPLIVWAQ